MATARAGPFATLVMPALLASAALVAVDLTVHESFALACVVVGLLVGVISFVVARYRVVLGTVIGVLAGYAVVLATTAAYLGEFWFIPLMLLTALTAAASLVGVTVRLLLR